VVRWSFFIRSYGPKVLSHSIKNNNEINDVGISTKLGADRTCYQAGAEALFARDDGDMKHGLLRMQSRTIAMTESGFALSKFVERKNRFEGDN